jgi:GntR family transcriptional regulator
VDEGTELLERRFVFFSDDTPEQISRSYLPLELVGDTPIADPDNEPWPGGNIAQLATVGKRVRRITESVGARMPTPDEVETLRLTSGTPVLVITRRMLTDKDPPEVVEVAADIVLPGDRVTLDYQIDL